MLIQFDRPNLRIDSSRYPQHLVLILLSRNLTPTSVTCELDSFDQLLAPTRVHYLDGDQRIIRATSDNGLQVSEYAVSFESLYDPDTRRRRQPLEFRLRVDSLYLEDRAYHTRHVELNVTFPLVGGVGTLTLNPTAGFQYDIASSIELRPPNIVQLCDSTEILTSYRRTHAGRVRSPEAHALRDWRIANPQLSQLDLDSVRSSFIPEAPTVSVNFPSLEQIENAVTTLTTSQLSTLLAIDPEQAIDLERERELLREELNPKVAPQVPTSRFVRPNLDTDELLPSDASLDQSPPKSSLSGEGKREGD
jgi:hypothetical protein